MISLLKVSFDDFLEGKMEKSISKSTLKRLPIYLQFLKNLDRCNQEYISATSISKSLSLGEVQVRKDLGSVSGEGKPKIGYKVIDLIDLLETYLGFKDTSDAIVIGCGKLGSAILGYEGFDEYGINLVAGFDLIDSVIIKNGKKIFPIRKMNELILRMKIKMVILCVPKEVAQKIADDLFEVGVRAIMNFAPTHIVAPDGIHVQNVNIATTFAMLAAELNK